MKYIIIDPEEGIFLGTAKHEDMQFLPRHPNDGRLIAMFSRNNLLDITKAVGFFNMEDAERYLKIYISKRCPYAFIGSVEDDTPGPYVDTIDIVKSGYGEYAWDMIDALPMPSQMDH
jgi:hypothetical protein